MVSSISIKHDQFYLLSIISLHKSEIVSSNSKNLISVIFRAHLNDYSYMICKWIVCR